jgi:hypothetical protein
MIRERLIHLHYDDSDMKMNDDQMRTLFNAFGKVSSYGIRSQSTNGNLDYLSISIDQYGNITAGFYEPYDNVESLKKSSQLWQALSQFLQEKPLVLNAKRKNNGNEYVFDATEGELNEHNTQ